MALIRWAPFREIETLQHEMNHLFDTLVDSGRLQTTDFVPAAELHTTPEAIVLKMEIPGIEPKDLDVQVTAEAVSISGERRSETRTEEKGIVRSEFRYGKFSRVIPLPSRVQNTKVDANYQDGILTLTMPKVEEEQNKVVKVSLG